MPKHAEKKWLRSYKTGISDAVGIPINKETIAQKYDALLEMESIFPLTKGKYPSKRAFYRAVKEDRIQYREDGSVLLYASQKTKCYCFVPRTQD